MPPQLFASGRVKQAFSSSGRVFERKSGASVLTDALRPQIGVALRLQLRETHHTALVGAFKPRQQIGERQL